MRRTNDYFPETGEGRGEVAPGIRTIDETAGAPFNAPVDEAQGFLGLAVTPKNVVVFYAVLMLMLIGLSVRAGNLQLLRGEEYRRLAEGNRIRVLPIASERGVIHDRSGRLLTRNIPNFTLTITPADLPKEAGARLDLIVRLAETVGLTPVDIERTLSRFSRNFASAVPVKEHLEYEKAALLDIQSGGMPGVGVILGTKREYILNSQDRNTPVLSLSHLLGYQGRVNESEYDRLKSAGYQPTDQIGKTGIEASYEGTLRGTYGRKQVEVDALGREQSVLAEDDPIQGKDLVLSIDAGLQATAEKALRRSTAVNGRGRGAAVALDPKTGEILALVSWPSYDANVFSRGISLDEYRALAEDTSQPLFPRAVSGLYPPGSTVKLVVAAGALAEKVITTSSHLLSSGGIRVGKWFFPDWKFGGHGSTDVIKAISESVNTFFYAIGGGWEEFEGLEIGRLRRYLRLFGLGEKTGIDLPGERDGFVPDAEWKARVKGEEWYIGDTYHLAIGQGDLLATPLQVAVWTSVFANGGDLLKPHVVKAVRSNNASVPTKIEVIRKQVVAPEYIETVRRGMRQTVVSGSARALAASPWPIAGKTGTAQWRQGEPNHAWFTGFAPYDDPKIVVSVLIEAGGEGSAAAAPVAREIIESWLRNAVDHSEAGE
jgi:penicillin-binding protein 2